MLNNVGSEVLIKAVITKIPTYAMNVFKLLTTWCLKINDTIAQFWWRGSDLSQKIHWKRWEVMTRVKQHE